MKLRVRILLTVLVSIAVVIVAIAWSYISGTSKVTKQESRVLTLLELVDKCTKYLVNASTVRVVVTGKLRIHVNFAISRSVIELFTRGRGEAPTRFDIRFNQTVSNIECVIGRDVADGEVYMYISVPKMNLTFSSKIYTEEDREVERYVQSVYMVDSLEFMDVNLKARRMRVCVKFNNVTITRPEESIVYSSNLTCVENEITILNDTGSFIKYSRRYEEHLANLSLELIRDLSKNAKFVSTRVVAGYETYCYRVKATVDLTELLASKKAIDVMTTLADMVSTVRDINISRENITKIVEYAKLLLKMLGLDVYNVIYTICVEPKIGAVLYVNASIENVDKRLSVLTATFYFNVNTFKLEIDNVSLARLDEFKSVNAIKGIKLPIVIAQITYTLIEMTFRRGTLGIAISSMLSGTALTTIVSELSSYTTRSS